MLWSKTFPHGRFEVYGSKPDLHLIHVHQRHTNKVVTYSGEPTDQIVADGIVSSLKNLKKKALAIKTADCLPIMFLNETHVALVHAGWKGLASDILLAPELLQIKWDHILIGPSIREYEVQKDFHQHFVDSQCFETREGLLYFNLQQEALRQLSQFTAKVEDSAICTLRNKDYNSYRRNKTTERNWNIFRI